MNLAAKVPMTFSRKLEVAAKLDLMAPNTSAYADTVQELHELYRQTEEGFISEEEAIEAAKNL